MLRTAAASSEPWAATARRAMVLLGHGDEVVDALVNDALHAGARMGRVAAVMSLPAVGGPKAIAALRERLHDDGKDRCGRDPHRLGELADAVSPMILGVTYQPDPAPAVSDAIIQAIIDRDAAYPVERIAKLSGLARRWGGAALALRIESHDERVPEALVRLGATWTAPVLEEIAQWPSTSSDLRVKLQDAARALQSS